ncbi:MAG: energy transducer TonB [Bryobacterales bacterium]|nr:energy transducer TonB [Bryobacterales bacterium]
MPLAFLLLLIAGSTLKPQEFPPAQSPLAAEQYSTPPAIIHTIEPEYTKQALKAKIEGMVVLHAIIGVDGVPSNITIDKGLQKGLDQKAVECLKKWRFSPALRGDDPVPAKVIVEVDFRLPPVKKRK